MEISRTNDRLRSEVLALLTRGVETRTTDEEFDRLARDVFAYQFEYNTVYHAYCEQQDRTPRTVTHWSEIPAVPTSAFKDLPVTCFPVGEAAVEFHTSGTTGENTGRHYFRTTELYDAAISPNFAAHLLPDNARLPMLILTPAPAMVPHSSLSHMLGFVAEKFGTDESSFFVAGGTLDVERVVRELCEAQWARQPVFLLGTAFAFVHLFDHLAKENLKFELADGSRAMETGGFKGRSRELPKAELYGLCDEFLQIPGTRVVNEYGMTELSSQFYDETMRVGRQSNIKSVPPWTRVVVIDPATGKPAAQGERGLIRIYDLANLDSALCLQTEDLGIAWKHGFEVLGRTAGAGVRGGSLNAESLRMK